MQYMHQLLSPQLFAPREAAQLMAASFLPSLQNSLSRIRTETPLVKNKVGHEHMNIKGWNLQTPNTFHFRALWDWSVSSVDWVDGSKTQIQIIKEPTQTGSFYSRLTWFRNEERTFARFVNATQATLLPLWFKIVVYLWHCKKWNLEIERLTE